MTPSVRRTAGFTLMELVTVMGILAILAAVIIPSYQYWQQFSTIDAVHHEVVQQLRLAEARARQGELNSGHGIYAESTQYTVYVGNSYLTRDPVLDKVFELHDMVLFPANVDVQFRRATGKPISAVTLSLMSTINNSEELITINSAGVVF